MKLLDYLIDNYGLSSFEANGYIMAGKVLVNEEVCSWIIYPVKAIDKIRIKMKQKDFVTRAGYKLEKAISEFALNVSGKVIIDIGASEGGFTDCLLKHGANRVYAVDVAYGILNYKLRTNPKVVALERKNAKFLTDEDIPEKVDMITSDVSFISLEKVIVPNIRFLKEDGCVALLFKPQFELPLEMLGKNGIPVNAEDVIDKIEEFVLSMEKNNVKIFAIRKSPIKGNSGNTEYLLYGNLVNTEILTRDVISDIVKV